MFSLMRGVSGLLVGAILVVTTSDLALANPLQKHAPLAVENDSRSSSSDCASHQLEFDTMFSEKEPAKMPLCVVLRRTMEHWIGTYEGRTAVCYFETPVQSEFGKIDWQPLDPKANLNTVREIFAWRSLRSWWMPGQLDLVHRVEAAGQFGDKPTADMEAIWEKHHLNLGDLIEKGEIRLEVAKVDLPGEIEPLRVFRMSDVILRESPERHFEVTNCKLSDGSIKPSWTLVFDRRNSYADNQASFNFHALGPRQMILWGGRVYVISLGDSPRLTTIEFMSDSGNVYLSQPTCAYRLK